MEKFGFSAERVVDAALGVLGRLSSSKVVRQPS
jgi:hypothetical protein